MAPLITEGWEGMFWIVTASVEAVPLPQLFEGVTVIFPEFAEVVTVTELEVPPAVLVHPAGKVQV